MKYFLCVALASVALVQANAPSAIGQALDWLPSIPQGNIQVKLKAAVGEFDGTFGDYQTPTDIVFPNDGSGRKFVAMQLGNIRVIDAAGNLQPVFLDTRSSNTAADPHFFTSLAFHNQFGKVDKPGYGKFYTVEVENAGTAPADFSGSLVTVAGAFQQVLYEYQMDDITSSVFAGTKREVMRFDRPGSGSGHNVGDITFGKDNYLYMTSGDGGVARSADGQTYMSENAQFLGNVYGKVLRIDPLSPELNPTSRDPISENGSYRVPRTNPFVSDPDPTTEVDETVDEIYAYGLRNPYRINFDSLKNQLYLGSVGQANIETIYRVTPGANFGWNMKEGSFLYDVLDRNNLVPDLDADANGLRDFAEAHGLTDPIFEYDHQDGVAVLGGFVYRGSRIPELFGKYVFGDFAGGEGSQGRLFYGDLSTHEIFEMQIATSGVPLPSFVYSIGQDPYGELYITGTTADGARGLVMQVLPTRTVRPPKGYQSSGGHSPEAVPEPETWALAVVMLGALALARRGLHPRRQHQVVLQ